MLISLILGWVALIIGFIAAMPFATFVFGKPFFAFVGAANIFFLVALPIIGFIQFAARHLFNKKTSTRTRTGMLLFWVFNVVSFFGNGSYVAREFNQEGDLTQRVEALSFSTDTVRLSMGNETAKNSLINIDNAKIVDDNLVLQNIVIDFVKSKDDRFRLVQTHFSRGRNTSEIEELTKAIAYNPIISDREIIFPADFFIQKGSKWRGQKVNIKLEIPEGKTIIFGDKESNRLDDYISRNAQWAKRIPSVSWHGEHIWTMQNESFYSKADALQEVGSDRGFKDFQKIIIKGNVKVNITKGDKYEVKLIGKERELKTVTMEQMGEILDVSTSTRGRKSSVTLNIVAPELERIDLEYTNEAKVMGFDGKKLDILSEGRKKIKVFVDVDSLYLNFRKNKSEIRGKGIFLKVKLSKRARMDAEYFTVNNALVIANDAKEIKLEVLDTLRTNLRNGSRMVYDEEPKVLIDERKPKKEEDKKQ